MVHYCPQDSFADHQETLAALHHQMKALKEQLTVAKANGEESTVHKLQVRKPFYGVICCAANLYVVYSTVPSS